MKVSLQWAQQYSNVDLLALSTDEILRHIGSQLGAVEEVIDVGSRYDKIVVARVVDCQKHSGADKLNVCLIDDGGVTPDVERNADNLVQVVCGAPNVRAGLLVAWLPPGSTVPSSIEKDPFVLGARELRGVVSNGMLASAHELGISDDHDGLLEISATATEEPKPGTPFKSLFGLDDVVIDCENKMFTHRPDCFGILGVARELAGITGQKFVSPNWYTKPSSEGVLADSQLEVTGKNDAPDKVPRFMFQVIENVQVVPSSLDIQSSLARVGSKAINNIVDLTNYYMHLTAQPTHAFDYDKVAKLCSDGKVSIFPRMARDGEKLELLNGKTITLTSADIVIATDTQPIALAGVMGGSQTEVDSTTKNIIIECATFNMYAIRRTSMRHGLFTDAVTRFNKGQSPFQNGVVLNKIVEHICSNSTAKAGMRFDSGHPDAPRPLEVTSSFINARLGGSISAVEMKTLLENVEFEVTIEDDTLSIVIPFWRMDIEIPEDIVEEIGRLYDYSKLPVSLPLRAIQPVTKNDSLELKGRVRSILSAAGANEILTYSFVSGKLLRDAGQNPDEAYQLSNALSPALEYYRLSLTPSVLSKVQQNIRKGYDRIALFEISNTHQKSNGKTEENVPDELGMISLVYSVNDKKVSKHEGAAFFVAKAYLDNLGHRLGRTFVYTKIGDNIEYEVTKPFDLTRSAFVSDQETGASIGILGEFTNDIIRNMKAPSHSAGFELSSATLTKLHAQKSAYVPLQKYPGSTQDITLTTSDTSVYGEITTTLKHAVDELARTHGYQTSLSTRGIYQKDPGQNKNITYQLQIHHPERTLTTEEVTTYVNSVVSTVESAVNAKRV